MNGKQAAIRAGYAERSAEMQASRLLRNDKVKQRVAELREAYFNENIMTAQQVEYELTRIALGLSNENTSLSKVQGKDVPKLELSINT